MNLKTRTAGQTMVINARRRLGMKTTPQPVIDTAAKAEAKAVSRPARRMRSKGPLQTNDLQKSPNPGGDPRMTKLEEIDLLIRMHEVQEEYLARPAYQCVLIQEVLRVTLAMIMEEEVDMMSRRRTRLFILMMEQDLLASLMVIQIRMVIMASILGCISP